MVKLEGTELGKEKKHKYVNHLLNIEKYNGYHEGSIASIIYLLLAVGIPAFFVVNIYVWLANLLFNPTLAIVIITTVYVLYGIRMALIFLGHEKERKAKYKKQLYSRYDNIDEYVRIKTVYQDDGCIEFFDGTIAFMIVAFNGNAGGIRKAKQIQKFLDIVDNYPNDILVQNTANGATLNQYYKKIQRFKDKRVASDYLAILDHNKQYITDKSKVVRTVYIFYGKRYERNKLRSILQDSLPKDAYFDVHLAERDEIIDVYSHEAQKRLDFEGLIVRRFATGKYFTSKVVAYDEDIPPELHQKTHTGYGINNRSFIPTRRVENGSTDYFSINHS